MNKLTETIPDDMPEWAIEAMAEGRLFNKTFAVVAELEKQLAEKDVEIERLVYALERIQGELIELNDYEVLTHLIKIARKALRGTQWRREDEV